TVLFIPFLLDNFFFCSFTITIIIPTSQSASSIGTTKESSFEFPFCHSTNPPYILLAALPDPLLAYMDSSLESKFNPLATLVAAAKAANPEEDDAKPAAVGT